MVLSQGCSCRTLRGVDCGCLPAIQQVARPADLVGDECDEKWMKSAHPISCLLLLLHCSDVLENGCFFVCFGGRRGLTAVMGRAL